MDNHPIKVEITTPGGEPKGPNETAIVGQRIHLIGSVSPSELEATEHKWTIGGEVIKSYTQSSSSGYRSDLEPENLDGDFMLFYWINGGENVEVKYEAVIAGHSVSAVVNYEVKRPAASLTSSITSAQPPTDVRYFQFIDPELGMMFGDPYGNAGPGITWAGTVTSVDGGEGAIKLIQLIKEHRAYRAGDICRLRRSLAVSSANHVFALDGGIQYGAAHSSIGSSDTVQIHEQDSPVSTVQGKDEISVEDQFELYLMFRPVGFDSIWVTLCKLEWSWTASAFFVGGEWIMNSGQIPANNQNPPSGIQSIELPQWEPTTTQYLPIDCN